MGTCVTLAGTVWLHLLLLNLPTPAQLLLRIVNLLSVALVRGGRSSSLPPHQPRISSASLIRPSFDPGILSCSFWHRELWQWKILHLGHP